MSKRDGNGLVLSARMVGDQGYVATVFSDEFGLVRGLIRKVDGLCMGDTVRFEHTRRLEGQLGRLNLEVVVSRAAMMFTDPVAALVAAHVAEVCHAALPEDHPYPDLYGATHALWHGPQPWWQRVVLWERAVLGATGYGLSLEDDPVPCPMGERLMYVSPTSGRAVSGHVGAPYAARLLPLPAMFGGPVVGDDDEVRNALNLTGAFLGKFLQGKDLTARARLAQHVMAQGGLCNEHADNDDCGVAGVEQRKYG
ncbi:MAG: DNA repair protein RecO C-terminal domain-containing protein [Alphaproteobacteria bacterium]